MLFKTKISTQKITEFFLKPHSKMIGDMHDHLTD